MEPTEVDVDELIEFWTLLDEDRELLAGKRGSTALGFALLLKHYSRYGRFPRGRGELVDGVVRFVAGQLGVDASDLGFYEWSGRTIEPRLFVDVAPRVLAGWRTRAAVEAPSHLRRHAPLLTVTLLAALVHQREREIIDTLVELLIATVHRIGARAERRVTNELINAFRKVTGKENILFSIAEAALEKPDGAVREVVFPAVTGGEQTLRELVHEFKTKGPVYRL